MKHFCPIPVSDRSHALGAGRTLPDPGVALAPEPAAALRSALLGGETHYTPRPGLPELQEEIGRRLEAAGAAPGGTAVITGGRQEALFVALAGARAEAGDASGSVALSPLVEGDPGVLAACALLDLFPVGDAAGAVARVVAPEEADGTAPVEIVDCGDRLLPGDAQGAFLAGVGEEAVLVGSLDGLPELAPFRVGFFRVPPRLLGRLRSLKQAVSICTAAPSQRTAALLLGAGPAKPRPRPTLAKPGKDDSRYSLMELAARLDGVVSLGRGDPDADAPTPVLEAACARIGETEPLDPLGQRWLRERIVEREEARTGIRWDPDTETLVTGGAQEGITLAMLALVGEREEVLLADPRYTSYVQAIALARGRMAPVPCGGVSGDGGQDFGMRAAATAEVLGQCERPRLLGIVNFSNPTGARTRHEEVEELCRLADRHHLWVLSDEVYADMALDGEGPILSPSTLPGMRNRTLTMGSVSKSYAMTGFRVGYLTGPADAVAACARAKAALSGPGPLFSQRAAAAALAGGDAFPARLREIYAPRRKLLLDGFARLGIPTAAQGGGFFVWADISRFGLSAEAFCRRLLTEARVLIFPGTAFGERWDRYARVSMLQSEELIIEALNRMDAFSG
ncbi:MAG: aminotransferase class I/II-fold pyridoxal phosphate-dependent enzyme [Acidobacteria bacterium]|nr:aminotransferase class I/II-fold pyridoxal phosphate-dependent enzyme [Acidobacteriota bacterium]MYF14074.1 aminotransferase class I/II-fold pyridoxal phosphate-dependent enzyme [Acidobacteriota bacterium]MYI97159.1 aminotransferase class I/II-fold pyridoxal phosphate-dependent enzyme [Acidobacteriota bacterium]